MAKSYSVSSMTNIRGNPDLEDTISRLRAYEQAGADVLYSSLAARLPLGDWFSSQS